VASALGPAAGDETLVVLRLEGRDFALRVTDVVEVLRMVAYVPVPGAPPPLTGLINVRGRTIPLVDLRLRLGLAARASGLETRIVVVSGPGGRPLGLLADEVVEAITLPRASIEPPDELSGPEHLLSAVARAGARVIPVLDPDRLGAGIDRLGAGIDRLSLLANAGPG
jgi:purine-binding chemotaxis protein CheW